MGYDSKVGESGQAAFVTKRAKADRLLVDFEQQKLLQRHAGNTA